MRQISSRQLNGGLLADSARIEPSVSDPDLEALSVYKTSCLNPCPFKDLYADYSFNRGSLRRPAVMPHHGQFPETLIAPLLDKLGGMDELWIVDNRQCG